MGYFLDDCKVLTSDLHFGARTRTVFDVLVYILNSCSWRVGWSVASFGSSPTWSIGVSGDYKVLCACRAESYACYWIDIWRHVIDVSREYHRLNCKHFLYRVLPEPGRKSRLATTGPGVAGRRFEEEINGRVAA